MSSTHYFTICLLFTVLESSFGATCTKSPTCVATPYTNEACDATSKVCTCVSGYFPIRTGCGRKLSKPAVEQPAGFSNLVLEEKSATLKCNSPDSVTEFEWYHNDKLIDGASKSTYTIATASASNVGLYKCKAKFPGNSNLDSDQSDALKIELFAKSALTLTKGPTISLSTQNIFAGKSVHISCNDIPMGYNTAKVAITKDDSTIVQTPLVIDEKNQQTEVKCELNDYPTSHTTNIKGGLSKLPTLVAEISAAKITITNAVESETYEKDTPITLKCVTTPESSYVDTSSKLITYAWFKGEAELTEETKETFDIPTKDDNYEIRCRATHTKPVDSTVIKITRDSNYLLKPTITANPTPPVLGSRLTLACGKSPVNGEEYSWKKDQADIAREFEHTIQLDNLATSDNGDYKCTVKRSQITQISDTFKVNVGSGREIIKASMFVVGLTILMSKVFA